MTTRVRPWCRHYQQNDFPDDHRCDAKIALLGEAPGEKEDLAGQPFVGKSGWYLSEWWREVGLSRSDFYIDNIYPFRPNEANDLSKIDKREVAEYASQALHRLYRQDCNVIVPTGNYALRALLGDSKLLITDWRGSILSWRGRKCIPTIHPAATMRQRVLSKLCKADWKRIASECLSREIEIPKRRLVIDPSLAELEEFRHGVWRCFTAPIVNGPPRVLSVDVENLRSGNRTLTCVGFSFDPLWSITVSTIERDYDGSSTFQQAQQWIIDLLMCGYPIVGQNWMTDLWKLVMWRSSLRETLQRSYIWDLIEMAHLLDPNDGGDTSEGSGEAGEEEGVRVGMLDLATLCSLYTKQPFYKHMGSSRNWEERQQYNGLDACIQREIFDVLWRMLNDRQLV